VIRVLSFSAQSSDVIAALDDAAAQAEDALNRQRGEVLDISHSLVLCGRLYIAAVVIVLEVDDLVA
jgi:hypothetical protein